MGTADRAGLPLHKEQEAKSAPSLAISIQFASPCHIGSRRERTTCLMRRALQFYPGGPEEAPVFSLLSTRFSLCVKPPV